MKITPVLGPGGRNGQPYDAGYGGHDARCGDDGMRARIGEAVVRGPQKIVRAPVQRSAEPERRSVGLVPALAAVAVLVEHFAWTHTR